jgi:hypothetical protein
MMVVRAAGHEGHRTLRAEVGEANGLEISQCGSGECDQTGGTRGA